MNALRWLRTVAGFSVALVFGMASAHANGRFPRAQHVVLSPGATPTTIAVRATFGLVISDDGGRSFRFFCEEAFEYLDNQDPSIALGTDGVLLVGTTDGLLAMRDRCVARRLTALADQQVVDLTTDPTGRVVYAAVVAPGLSPTARVARSGDGGESFRLPDAGLAGIMPETVEVAPSNSQRVYLSGTDLATQRERLFRSDDGGATFQPAGALPDGVAATYVSAVDPARPDTLYVRAVLAGASSSDADTGATALLRSDDAGDTFREVGQTPGPMYGFALSDDGRKLWVGGPDGLERSDDGGPFLHLRDAGVECLRYRAGSLYVCDTFVRGGTMLSRSRDDGVTTEPFVSFADILLSPRCAANTIVASTCSLRWPTVAARIGAPELPSMDAGTDAGPPRPNAPTCGCRALPRRDATARWPAWLPLTVGALAGQWRRRRARPRSGAA